MQQPQRRPPTMQERWAALAGQQQAVIVLATVAVILMIIILILLISGGSDDDNDDVGVVPTATNTPTIIEVTSTPEPTEEVEPTTEPEPEPTATPEPTPEPEPTETPEPTPEPTEEPTEEPEPTATPEPEPTATPEPEPTATPEPEPTPVPEVLSGEVRVEDPEGDVRSPEGAEPPAALPMVDLRAVELDFDDDDEIEVRFFLNDDVPGAIDPGIVLTWTLIIWIGDGESYRLSLQLEQDDWTVTLVDSTTGDEFILDIDPDLDDEELRLEIPRAPVERLIEPFTWAAMTMLETGDGQLFGDNLPDAGDAFNLEPNPEQRRPFPE